MAKPGSTLSAVIRNAWSHKALQTLGKTWPDRSTGSARHVFGESTGNREVDIIMAALTCGE
jgi:hypothetical protein